MSRPAIAVLDAAHGTRLIARGLDLRRDDPALWLVSHPDEIRRIHLADLNAGAEVLHTCTFGANRNWLSRFGSFDVAGLQHRAVELAGECIRESAASATIAGCLGPTSLESESAFREQLDALCEAGVQRIVLETLSADQVSGLCARLSAIAIDRPLFVTLWHWGDRPEVAARQLADHGVAGWGVNCLSDPVEILRVLRRLHAAGMPATILKPSIDPVEGLVDLASQCLPLGITSVGGCCGTDHQHIAALRHALRSGPNFPATP